MLALYLSIFFLSAAVLAYEVAFTRIFSITQWYHFAYMIISIALLGFGASGSFISIARDKLLSSFRRAYLLLSLLAASAIVLSFIISQRIPFDPFLIVWERRQFGYLFQYYIVLFIPFFLAATCVGLALIKHSDAINKIYFANLFGSGVGAVAAVLLMYWMPPARAVVPVAALAFASALAFSLGLGRRAAFGTLLFASMVLLGFAASDAKLNISQYKGLSTALNLPGAKIEEERWSPYGLIDVVSSPAIRHAPGLSLAFSGELPEQKAIFVDGESAGVINRGADPERLRFLDWMSQALPYHMLKRPRVLAVGVGGGSEVQLALLHNARSVTALDMDPNMIELVRDRYDDFSGHVYRRSEVETLVAEARNFLEATGREYDLVQVSMLDSFAASSVGLYALTENYVYTVEAVERCLDRLSAGGMLAMTRWLRTPPRDNLKLFATAVEALQRRGVERPGDHLVFVRSWATATLLVKQTPFAPAEIEQAARFAEERLFDIIYYPGVNPEEVNVHNLLPEDMYHHGALKILSPARDELYREYAFNIRPATDERPYFFHFFKWKVLPLLVRSLGREWVPFVEWGYVVLLATLIQAAAASAVLILLPLLALRRGKEPGKEPGRLGILIYFLALGFGFLFIEMAFIQKLMLFLARPVYAVSVTLSAFLIFSGLGSLAAPRLKRYTERSAASAALTVSALALLYLLLLKPLLSGFMVSSDGMRATVAVAAIAPLAFFMGMPFPLGLERTARRGAQPLAWAWAVNGCASVLGAVSATVLAMGFGSSLIILAAACLYFVAALASLRL